jgi:glycosyltransferase involved in cell wall biosynthesis
MLSKVMLRVLCLDIEGGYGGSSKSLFESIINLRNSDVQIEVWCRRNGPIVDKYKEHNISVKFTPTMPKVTSVKRHSRNLAALATFFIFDWPRSHKFRKQLQKVSEQFDVIHCNHEGLYWLARWLNIHTHKPITMHKRTNIFDNIFSKLQVLIIKLHVKNIVFITENEEKNYIQLGGSKNHGKVIPNIVPPLKNTPAILNGLLGNESFKLCTLANYSYLKGVDRLIDVAKILIERRKKVLFVIAGSVELTRSLPGKLGSIAKKGGDLSDYAFQSGVEDMFLFLGHVTNPERVLSSCNALIRPSREYNPWGRDVLEALSFGLPVIATGTYNRFVENRVTGFLLDEFDPKKVADCIVELLQNEQLVKHMGEQGKKRVKELCNGPDRAEDLQHFWQKVIDQ